jgi:DNA-binding response OmpR family regulator
MTRILLADNDPMLLPILALHLGNEDYEVVCAEDGEAALAAARTGAPDLLVVNVGLTVGPRRTLYEFISDDPKLVKLPVIYLVAERTNSRASPPNLPAQTVIRKPVPIKELLGKIAEALDETDAAADEGEEADEADEQRHAA